VPLVDHIITLIWVSPINRAAVLSVNSLACWFFSRLRRSSSVLHPIPTQLIRSLQTTAPHSLLYRDKENWMKHIFYTSMWVSGLSQSKNSCCLFFLFQVKSIFIHDLFLANVRASFDISLNVFLLFQHAFCFPSIFHFKLIQLYLEVEIVHSPRKRYFFTES